MKLVEVKSNCYHWFSKIVKESDNEIEIEHISCKFKTIPTKFRKTFEDTCRTLDGCSGKNTNTINYKKYENGEFYINIFG